FGALFVAAGTFLGRQGDYSGDPNNPVGVHLHFSIVKDDGQGNFMSELSIRNTYDPSPYFGIELNAKNNDGQPPLCNALTRLHSPHFFSFRYSISPIHPFFQEEASWNSEIKSY
ncbi:MAG: hypothetical protein KJZ57_08265, partial [Anaerolineales bacterium]|nr:hypothetical protein [Anaerolineales bacterium]